MRLTGTLLTALLAAAALLTAAGQTDARAAEPGVVLDGDFFASDHQLDGAHRSGARWIRVFAYRNQLEIAPGVLSPDLVREYQRVVNRYGWEGLKTEIVLVGTPSWESGSSDHLVPPDPAGFARFARQFAAALQFVGAYEIWNEADAEKWWRGAPDPAAYTRLLQAVYPGLKEASGGSEVLVGGLTGNNYEFVDQLYANGAQGSFDGVSVHTDTACGIASPYSFFRDPNGRISRWSFLGYREVLASMAAGGDGDKGLWFTELGWSTSGAVCDQGMWARQKAGGVTEELQAQYLREAWHCIAAEPRVRGAFWFSLQDLGHEDVPDHRFGLLRRDGSEKPAFAAFAAVARAGDQLTGPCGDFGGPAITMLELGDRGATGVYRKQLRIKVSAADDQWMRRITLYLNGKKLLNFGKQPGPVMVGEIDLDQAKLLPNGRHELLVVARDGNGNEAQQSFAVTKVAEKAPAKKKKKKKKKRRRR